MDLYSASSWRTSKGLTYGTHSQGISHHSFYGAAWNADGVYGKAVCLSVRLSVCPSDKRVHCDKTEEKSVQIFIPYERLFSLVFWEEEWLVGGDPFY